MARGSNRLTPTLVAPRLTPIASQPTQVVVRHRASRIAKVLQSGTVKATYDTRTDTLSIIPNADVAVAGSDEDKLGVILDYGENGNLISPEILDESKRFTKTRRIELGTVG
jgi:uncharacterized protein YuzE